jgi:hypothetical protein
MDKTFTVKAGFLTKKGRIMQNWKRRFFTLNNHGILTYYTSPNQVHLLHSNTHLSSQPELKEQSTFAKPLA